MSTTSAVDTRRGRAALRQRLESVCAVIVDEPTLTEADDDAKAAAQCLVAATTAVHGRPRADHAWLLFTAVASAFPHEADVRALLRLLELESPDLCATWLLEEGHRICTVRGSPLSGLELTSDVVVDVDYTASHDLHTGIQRVVRETVPRWAAANRLCLAAWTPGGGAMRLLDEFERGRVLDWRGSRRGQARLPARYPTLLVPWHTTVVLAEVPSTPNCPALSALAQFSGSAVTAIGYDCIPVVSADLLPAAEPEKFVRYLSVIKHASTVCTISASAADEFSGFAAMLPTQGLTPPLVVECPLPIEGARGTEAHAGDQMPTILCVGSHEPRKNHVAVLVAAERLWREGLPFRLSFIGGSGWDTQEFDRWVHRLARLRRPVTVHRSVSDCELWAAYRSARFTVFPSLHEGYGLPVAESLAAGTPAITSDFGSMLEIAVDGGALTVDPRNLDDLTDAMRTLLTDDEALTALATEAAARPARDWDEYAAASWTLLTEHTGAE